jgi:hypothetical protein
MPSQRRPDGAPEGLTAEGDDLLVMHVGGLLPLLSGNTRGEQVT